MNVYLRYSSVPINFMKLLNELEILNAVAEGDTKAFKKLFYAYHTKLSVYIYRLTKDYFLTEELVQDVFVKIWDNRSMLTEVTRFDQYLFRASRNSAINALRDIANHAVKDKKWKAEYQEDEQIPQIGQNSSEINVILIRYAEVLLTYAEAQNEAIGPDESVYNALNQLRARPSVAMPAITPRLSKEQMREVIRNERRIELAFEGLYYSDIRRWRIAEVVNNGPVLNHQGEEVSQRSFDKDRDYLWPIPANQIQLNPNLENNPNWY